MWVNSCDDMSGANILKPTARRNAKRLVRCCYGIIMKKLVIINNNYYQRFHNCNAFYRYDSYKNCYDFISYKTFMMRIVRANGRYVIHAYDYKGVTTQKQMSRFIFEFCGYGYYKAYKKAREIMRKNNGISMILKMIENFETWIIKVIRNDSEKFITFNI